MGFHLPGERIDLASLGISDAMRAKLKDLGQRFTYRSDSDSTALAVAAARDALADSGTPARRIGLVISAPTLLPAYGFEIPAVALRAVLGLDNAETLNISQGCVGVFTALREAYRYLVAEPDCRDTK